MQKNSISVKTQGTRKCDVTPYFWHTVLIKHSVSDVWERQVANQMQIKYYVWKMHSDNKWFLPIYSRFEKKNIQVGLLGCIYQLISTANPALLEWNWAELAVLIS